MNEIAKHRPRSTLVLGIAQENRQIRQLKQEKEELQMALEEHQSALQLIMHKYRSHTVHLLHANRIDANIAQRQIKSKVSCYVNSLFLSLSTFIYLFHSVSLSLFLSLSPSNSLFSLSLSVTVDLFLQQLMLKYRS